MLIDKWGEIGQEQRSYEVPSVSYHGQINSSGCDRYGESREDSPRSSSRGAEMMFCQFKEWVGMTEADEGCAMMR